MKFPLYYDFTKLPSTEIYQINPWNLHLLKRDHRPPTQNIVNLVLTASAHYPHLTERREDQEWMWSSFKKKKKTIRCVLLSPASYPFHPGGKDGMPFTLG